MVLDLSGIDNVNEYYSSHYLETIFEGDVRDTLASWGRAAAEGGGPTPWAALRRSGSYFQGKSIPGLESRNDTDTLAIIKERAEGILSALGYPRPAPEIVPVESGIVPVFLSMPRPDGTPLLWAVLAHTDPERGGGLLQGRAFDGAALDETPPREPQEAEIEDLINRAFFNLDASPRWLILAGLDHWLLLDRNKWNGKRYLAFQLDEIFARPGDSALQAMAVLLHRETLCPGDGLSLLDLLEDKSRRHAFGVSEDLKYALREAIELLGNEVLHDWVNRQGLEIDKVDAQELTRECLRYMYRILFILFIEARTELGYAPTDEVYTKGYSLESLREIAEDVRGFIDHAEVAEGTYLQQTLAKLFNLIYDGYPFADNDLEKLKNLGSLHGFFHLAPLKAHIFDPALTPLVGSAKLRNRVMLKIIDLMSVSRQAGGRGRHGRRGRISYSSLGVNQLGAVYEGLLSYTGFIAKETLYEVKKAGAKFDELAIGYFVPESELENYTEAERVRFESTDERAGQLRRHERGEFIYRLAGRERQRSASYYTPESLTKCLVKYALRDLLRDKTSEEILELTVCEPAMGSAAFLNEAINQLAEAYVERRERETGNNIPPDRRLKELQKVKMFLADRNVYGVDLNHVAVELAEVSLWLNSLFEGDFVPWFGTQLMTGNSLIGARRQVYGANSLKGAGKWWEEAPARVEPGTERGPNEIYHFLLSDPGMASYDDKVIKSLASDKIKIIAEWKKDFTKSFDDDDIETLFRLSKIIDNLWRQQTEKITELEEETTDHLSIFGYSEEITRPRTSIREKDWIFSKFYKSEDDEDASPYARLKLAMDYWCALWFWPIDRAESLPDRTEFLFELGLILEGGVYHSGISAKKTRDKPDLLGDLRPAQPRRDRTPKELRKLFPQLASQGEGYNPIKLNQLCEMIPRLKLVREIAQNERFFHWELQFAHVFAKRGGFDLVLGNPPWIKLEWNERDVLADRNPRLAIRAKSASEVAKDDLKVAFLNEYIKKIYITEYVSMAGGQNFLNATQNYPTLKGQQTNLYKCFIPQSWTIGNKQGYSALIHENGIFNDDKGNIFRPYLYNKLVLHYRFINEFQLFNDIHHHKDFSINIYQNKQLSDINFSIIVNLFDTLTIDASYSSNGEGNADGLKDVNNKWSIKGHKDRIINISTNELKLIAKFYNETENYLSVILPTIHLIHLINIIQTISNNCISFNEYILYHTKMYDESNSQKKGIIKRDTQFPKLLSELIYSGPHISLLNPYYKVPKQISKLNSDYDVINLTYLPNNYIPRTNYIPNYINTNELRDNHKLSGNSAYIDHYRLIIRRMLSITQQRTVNCCIIPPNTGHIDALISFIIKSNNDLIIIVGLLSSLIYDFIVKVFGKENFYISTMNILPMISDINYRTSISYRAIKLNCLTIYYDDLIKSIDKKYFISQKWSKNDPRLNSERLKHQQKSWTYDFPLRTDYERRQALVEIDVLTSMALNLTLDDLRMIYRVQFPVFRDVENNTWYDRRGRIVFTNNAGLPGVGFSRPEWEKIKDASSGVFTREIDDDTMPGGPVKRTIEYQAPFDRCDRERDYETAWEFFEREFKG